MIYYLYNVLTSEVVATFKQPYALVGEGTLPTYIVELVGVSDPEPQTENGQKLEAYYEVDLSNKQYITKWRIMPYIPEEIPLWAFRSSLFLNNLHDTVQPLIDSLEEPTKTIANIQWTYGNFIVRNHPLIIALSNQLGLSEKQVDDIFITGSLLK